MSKLKIYCCSGVGQSGTASVSFTYWLDGTRTVSNTTAVNSLLARINSINTELQYLELSEEDIIIRANAIDIYVIALKFAEKYSGNDIELSRAGRLIQKCINEGGFDFQSIDDGLRGDHLDSLYDNLNSAANSGKDSTETGEFYTWWMENIIPNNRVALSKEQQERSEQFFQQLSGVGATGKYGDLSEYIDQAGSYFLYTYFSPSVLSKLPYYIRKKAAKQKEVWEYLVKSFVPLYGSQQDLEMLARADVIRRYKDTPENIVKKLAGTKGVGIATEVILAIISAVVAVLTTIISVVMQYAGQAIQAKYAVPEDVDSAVPSDDDWEKAGKVKKDNSGILKLGIIAAALFLIIKKK